MATKVLIDSQGKELRISEDEVDEVEKSEIGPMPTNFIEIIPEREFFDLLAFLLSQQEQK